MKVVELANLQREDVQIFYNRKYAATAVLDLTARTANVDIEFSIEMNSFGNKFLDIDPKVTVAFVNGQLDHVGGWLGNLVHLAVDDGNAGGFFRAPGQEF